VSVETKRISAGISGLDEILNGGLLPGRAYLIRGGPGTGKTTLGFHFLSEGSINDENTLFITLTESIERLQLDAEQKGFKIDQIEFLGLNPTSILDEGQYNVVHSGEVEQEPLINEITERINEMQPKRIFLDSVSHLRYLSPDSFQYRKLLMSLINLAVEQGATLLLSSEASSSMPDDDLQFLCDGVINLGFGYDKRQVRISKLRGSDFLEGEHSMRLSEWGMKVYPALKPKKARREYSFETISSGIPEIDELLHGGIERGTATVISGPTGVGKTTLGVQFLKEAAGRGERSVVYTFEEAVGSLQRHCEAVNIPVSSMLEKGTLSLVKIDPLEYMPDEFSHHVRQEVEEMGTKIVMLDSISGYRLSFEEGQHEGYEMLRHLHSLSEYLKSLGVTVILINEIQNITGDFRVSDQGISYLADNIIFMRYLEIRGEMNKAIGVLKKRLSNFEKTLREAEITKFGFKIGKPLTELRGVLTGNPEFIALKKEE